MNKIEYIDIIVKNGNIAAEKADCIVVPQFSNCASYGGVGYAIEVAGMAAGLDEYDKIAQKRPLRYGDSMITASGKPGVKLAHVATAGANDKEQPMAVVKSIVGTLVSANQQKLQHIAIPEFGTGIIGNLTQEQSAQAIFNAVYEFAKANPASSIKQVSLVIFRGSTAPALKVLTDKTYVKLPANMIGSKEFNMGVWLYGMCNNGIGK